MIRHFYTILFFIISKLVVAQIPMQSWRVHFSINNAKGIAATKDAVFMAASNGVVVYDATGSVSTLTVANGLSDMGASTIESNGQIVAVGYSNGNIDLIDGNTIENIPWIKLAQVSGDKTIHAFNFQGDLLYVSSGVGLVVFDLIKREIRDTYFPYLNPNVYGTAFYHDTIYCATENGIYFAPLSNQYLNNLNNWTKKTDLPGGVVNGPFIKIATFADELLFVYNSIDFNGDTLYRFKNNTLSNYGTNLNIQDIRVDESHLILSQYSSVNIINTSFIQEEILFEYNGRIPEPASCIFHNNEYWVSDKNHGLIEATNSYITNVIYDNSPYSDGCYRLDIQYGKVLVAGGGITQNLVNNYFRNGVYLFENETWTNFNYENQDSIYYNKDWDFVSVAINPNNTNQMAFSGNSEGGLKMVFDGKNVTEVYDENNSSLEANGDKILIGDMHFDQDGNLWIVSTGTEPLKVRTANGEWYSFFLGSSAKDRYPYRLMIDNNGVKWVAVTNASLIAYDDKGTIADKSDDEMRIFSTSEGYGNVPSIFVKAIAQDLDGEIWIGTEEGLAVLYSTNQLFDGGYGDYDFNPILIQVDGEVEKLLGTTYITSIAIDGGNRKWIGTSSAGVFCLSPDGLTEIYRFTTENSPLISNNVLDIRIDHLSGEVYFATDKGLVSFRSDASIFDETFSDVKVFPNPVRPDYSGPITIQGLGFDADVTITDISGNVVLKTTSNGGTVVWNGNTLQGERVQSGVYLVWSASPTGKGKNVGKILFIN